MASPRLISAAAGGGMKLTTMRLFPLLILCLLFACDLRAEDRPASFAGQGLTVQLVSDVTTIQAGQTFQLGLWVRHEPGYHTYWQNPGLAGVPTKLVPQLPAGFTVGSMIYPPPDKVRMAAINVHGYERDVLVAIPVTAPSTLTGGPLTIPVEATWMCCRRTCNPGLARLSLTLRTGPDKVADAVWEPKFQALRSAQPPVLTGWELTATRFTKEIELTAYPPPGQTLPEAPQFFSLDNLICSHPPQSWQKEKSGYRVRLALSDFLPEDTTRLRGLLFGQGTWLAGKTAPYAEISVPISPASP